MAASRLSFPARGFLGLMAVGGFLLTAATPASAQLLGPVGPYVHASDSPFALLSFTTFFLEDFEDATLTSGWVASAGGRTSVEFGPGLHDSVDGDDGVIDGSGLDGDSWFLTGGAVRFDFVAAILGGLPTHAGIVWTDGGGTVTFEAFDQNGVSLGTVNGAHSDGSFNGGTAEDRFYGVINPGGISAIAISNPGGLEVDHLQYGFVTTAAAPEPGTLMLALGAGAFLASRRRKA